MSISNHFSLPYLGMKDGFHQYRFDVDDRFFKNFDHSPIHSGTFVIDVEVDKRPGLSELQFDIRGDFATSCDRCLADIRLPVTAAYTLLVKVSNLETDNDEVIFIKDDQSHLDLTQIIYEFICLSLPVVNTYDCEKEIPRVCNDEVLNKLQMNKDKEKTDETDMKSVWQNLKNWQTDN